MPCGIGVFGDQIPRDGIGWLSPWRFSFCTTPRCRSSVSCLWCYKNAPCVGFHEQRIIQRRCGPHPRNSSCGRIVCREVRRAHALHRFDVTPLRFSLPPNIKCSNRCAKPVFPASRSSSPRDTRCSELRSAPCDLRERSRSARSKAQISHRRS